MNNNKKIVIAGKRSGKTIYLNGSIDDYFFERIGQKVKELNRKGWKSIDHGKAHILILGDAIEGVKHK